MRPLLVLILVIAAFGVFFVAMKTGSDVNDTTGIVNEEVAAPSGDEPNTQAPVLAQGGGTRTAREVPVADQADDRVNASDGPTNMLSGSVLNMHGQKIASADVTLTRIGRTTFFFNDMDRSGDVTVQTSAEGLYEFKNVDAFDGYALIVRHPDYCVKEIPDVRVIDSGPSEEADIVLGPGISLSGWVRDTGSSPVIGAQIYLGMTAFNGNEPGGPDSQQVTTDNQGHYEFRHVGNGSHSMTVTASGYGRLTIPQLLISGTDSIEKDLTLDIASMIAGRVITNGSEALENAKITAYAMNAGGRQTRSSVKTDAEGEFTIEDVPEGTYTLMIDLKGYESKREQKVETGNMNVLVELMPHPTVSGFVLIEDTGKPLTSFDLQLRTVMPNSPQTVPEPRTRQSVKRSKDGSFKIPVLKPGSYVVEAKHPRYAGTFSETFTIAKGQDLTDVNVRMTSGGTMVGRIVNTKGEPIKGALIASHDKDWSDDMFMITMSDLMPIVASERKAKSNAKGEFKLKGLTPSDYLIQVTHPEYSKAYFKIITVDEGVEAKVPDINLLSGGTVHGIVYDPAGLPLSGSQIQLSMDAIPDGMPVSYKVKSDSEGLYKISHVLPGSYSIKAVRTSEAGSNPFQHIQDMTDTRFQFQISDGDEVLHDFRLSIARPAEPAPRTKPNQGKPLKQRPRNGGNGGGKNKVKDSNGNGEEDFKPGGGF